MRVITKESKRLAVPGLYVNYEPLDRSCVGGNSSILYSHEWMLLAKGVYWHKDVFVPIDFALVPEESDPEHIAIFIEFGLKPIDPGFDKRNSFPAAIWVVSSSESAV